MGVGLCRNPYFWRTIAVRLGVVRVHLARSLSPYLSRLSPPLSVSMSFATTNRYADEASTGSEGRGDSPRLRHGWWGSLPHSSRLRYRGPQGWRGPCSGQSAPRCWLRIRFKKSRGAGKGGSRGGWIYPRRGWRQGARMEGFWVLARPFRRRFAHAAAGEGGRLSSKIAVSHSFAPVPQHMGHPVFAFSSWGAGFHARLLSGAQGLPRACYRPSRL